MLESNRSTGSPTQQSAERVAEPDRPLSPESWQLVRSPDISSRQLVFSDAAMRSDAELSTDEEIARPHYIVGQNRPCRKMHTGLARYRILKKFWMDRNARPDDSDDESSLTADSEDIALEDDKNQHEEVDEHEDVVLLEDDKNQYEEADEHEDVMDLTNGDTVPMTEYEKQAAIADTPGLVANSSLLGNPHFWFTAHAADPHPPHSKS